jgi:hypothetical protein
MAHSAPSVSYGFVAMMTAENCRAKAAELLGAAEAATDPKTSASFRRTAELWTTLALQIEKDPHTVRQRNAGLKQSHQAEPSKANTDTVQAADVLRERLQLSDFSMDEPPDSTCPSSKFLRQRAGQIKGGSGSSG